MEKQVLVLRAHLKRGRYNKTRERLVELVAENNNLDIEMLNDVLVKCDGKYYSIDEVSWYHRGIILNEATVINDIILAHFAKKGFAGNILTEQDVKLTIPFSTNGDLLYMDLPAEDRKKKLAKLCMITAGQGFNIWTY